MRRRRLRRPRAATRTPRSAACSAPRSTRRAWARARASKVVTLTEQEGSGDELQVAIMNLAATQSLAGNYSDAEASFMRVITLLEAGGTRASSRLARANAGLAVVYHDAGRHEMAVARFESALAL